VSAVKNSPQIPMILSAWAVAGCAAMCLFAALSSVSLLTGIRGPLIEAGQWVARRGAEPEVMNQGLAISWVTMQWCLAVAFLATLALSCVVLVREASLNPYRIFGSRGVAGARWLRLFLVGQVAIGLLCVLGMVVLGKRVFL